MITLRVCEVDTFSMVFISCSAIFMDDFLHVFVNTISRIFIYVCPVPLPDEERKLT